MPPYDKDVTTMNSPGINGKMRDFEDWLGAIDAPREQQEKPKRKKKQRRQSICGTSDYALEKLKAGQSIMKADLRSRAILRIRQSKEDSKEDSQSTVRRRLMKDSMDSILGSEAGSTGESQPRAERNKVGSNCHERMGRRGSTGGACGFQRSVSLDGGILGAEAESVAGRPSASVRGPRAKRRNSLLPNVQNDSASGQKESDDKYGYNEYPQRREDEHMTDNTQKETGENLGTSSHTRMMRRGSTGGACGFQRSVSLDGAGLGSEAESIGGSPPKIGSGRRLRRNSLRPNMKSDSSRGQKESDDRCGYNQYPQRNDVKNDPSREQRKESDDKYGYNQYPQRNEHEISEDTTRKGRYGVGGASHVRMQRRGSTGGACGFQRSVSLDGGLGSETESVARSPSRSGRGRRSLRRNSLLPNRRNDSSRGRKESDDKYGYNQYPQRNDENNTRRDRDGVGGGGSHARAHTRMQRRGSTGGACGFQRSVSLDGGLGSETESVGRSPSRSGRGRRTLRRNSLLPNRRNDSSRESDDRYGYNQHSQRNDEKIADNTRRDRNGVGGTSQGKMRRRGSTGAVRRPSHRGRSRSQARNTVSRDVMEAANWDRWNA